MKILSRLKKLSRGKKIVLSILSLVLLFYSAPRLLSMVTFLGAHKPSLSKEFHSIDKILPSESATVSHLRVGLPHSFQDRSSFYAALWFTNSYSYDGYLFKERKVNTSKKFNDVTTAILTSIDSFEPYAGPKLCGGYHADYMFTLTEAGEDYHFMVCFGCHEVLIYTPSGSRIVDLDREAYNKLRDIWQSEL